MNHRIIERERLRNMIESAFSIAELDTLDGTLAKTALEQVGIEIA